MREVTQKTDKYQHSQCGSTNAVLLPEAPKKESFFLVFEVNEDEEEVN
jgi:hypothetical protein